MTPIDEAVRVIDSHTAGEPTRVVIQGGPDLGEGSLMDRRERFREVADDFRRMVILEPRGHEAMVGALLCEPTFGDSAAGVIFFNNAGYLGMCGHGAIGVAVTLAWLGRIQFGKHCLETPVGQVEIDLLTPNCVAIENVPSYRYRCGVQVNVPGLGYITGDIAWGGNWFFLCDNSPCALVPAHIPQLSDAANRIRETLRAQGITGVDGADIDHVEFFGPPEAEDAHSRNFVDCPGGAYDRSPCGTGTSAKIACLAADDKLQAGQTWIQESIIGSRFAASYRRSASGQVIPRIVGEAYVCGESRLIRQAGDPFATGIDTRGPQS